MVKVFFWGGGGWVGGKIIFVQSCGFYEFMFFWHGPYFLRNMSLKHHEWACILNIKNGLSGPLRLVGTWGVGTFEARNLRGFWRQKIKEMPSVKTLASFIKCKNRVLLSHGDLGLRRAHMQKKQACLHVQNTDGNKIYTCVTSVDPTYFRVVLHRPSIYGHAKFKHTR